MTESPAIEDALSHVPLLKHLNRRQIVRLAARMTRRSYPAGAIIVRQGDTSMSFYVVLSGAVQIVRTTDRGASVPVGVIGPGGFFGEMGLIDDLERAATVAALEPTECGLLVRWDFQNELRNDPEIALALLPVLNQRIRELDERLDVQEVSR
jgi:CRP-like cAMP-binding protein